MRQKKLLSISEVVDTLNTLSAIDPFVDPFILSEVKEASYFLEEKYDLDNSDHPTIITLTRDCFKIIYKYLFDIIEKDSSYTMSHDSFEDIKSMMLLVGEAAKKIESYAVNTEKVEGLILNSPEYRELQDFYQTRLNQTITQEKIGKWVLGIGKLPFDFSQKVYQPQIIAPFTPQHLFIDLDTVRSDNDYELFFIRKEGGGRFFNPRLIRNMHLISEFGFQGAADAPPLFLPTEEWLDTIAHDHAVNIIRKVGPILDLFAIERGKFKETDLQNEVTKALVALLLASQGRFLHYHRPAKSCFHYYCDFLQFFRSAVQSYDYQKLISYPPRENNKLGNLFLSLIQQVARVIFFEMPGIMNSRHLVNQLMIEGYQKGSGSGEDELTLDLGKTLESDNRALNDAFKEYGNSALRKTLEDLNKETQIGFDPFSQNNWPNRYMDLVVGEEDVKFIRLPSPTTQKSIERPFVIEEFKAALRGVVAKDPHAKLLLLNFQNRTSWKDTKRCLALEDLNDKNEFNESLAVTTFEIDTDFYNQAAPYDEEVSWNKFKKMLKEHLINNHEAMFLPQEISEFISDQEIEELIFEIHQVFFEGNLSLTKEERVSFIDLSYQFLILKIIDAFHPKYVALTCKDGIEASNFYFAQIYASLLLFNDRSIAQTERENLNAILFSPAILFRERVPQGEKIERLETTLKLIEAVRTRKSPGVFKDTMHVRFGRFFNSGILEGQWFY